MAREIVLIYSMPCLLPGSQPGNFDHTIVNDDLEIAYEKLKGILIQVWFKYVCSIKS